ncbi:hypothetical protein FIBSPDRAFT_1026010 [Athelia psychrophila]|uniref:Uncharacterized protein n=1 Tax=Athelia psychrophila TaxID=1759441 RepID=A0A166HNU7_9AGAM|nr:hypothetical protein FIBSPDRAFT_1026010 [Fibularhizoctonia sp. CBS 109695]
MASGWTDKRVSGLEMSGRKKQREKKLSCHARKQTPPNMCRSLNLDVSFAVVCILFPYPLLIVVRYLQDPATLVPNSSGIRQWGLASLLMFPDKNAVDPVMYLSHIFFHCYFWGRLRVDRAARYARRHPNDRVQLQAHRLLSAGCWWVGFSTITRTPRVAVCWIARVVCQGFSLLEFRFLSYVATSLPSAHGDNFSTLGFWFLSSGAPFFSRSDLADIQLPFSADTMPPSELMQDCVGAYAELVSGLMRKSTPTPKIKKNWHRPFVAFLEECQPAWNGLGDGEPKQAFLRDTRDALKEWAAEKANLTGLLPEEKHIRWVRLYIFAIITFQHLASYFTQGQPKPVRSTTRKAPAPKTVKAKYHNKDVIRSMFAERVEARTAELFLKNTEPGKKKFNFSRRALQEVEDGLTKRETREVAEMLESWNSGHAMTDDAKRRLTESMLPRLAEKFIMEVDQKHMAQVFMIVGIPDKNGDISMTSFETKPPPGIKKFSRSAGWKACGMFNGCGFEDWIMGAYSKDTSGKPDDEDWRDLIYYADRQFPAGSSSPEKPLPVPMLTTFSKNWTNERILPAWREYCTQMFNLQSGREEGPMPWKRVWENLQGIVTMAEGVSVNWEEPSRLTYKQLKDNWESCPKDKFERTLANYRRRVAQGISTDSDVDDGERTGGEEGKGKGDGKGKSKGKGESEGKGKGKGKSKGKSDKGVETSTNVKKRRTSKIDEKPEKKSKPRAKKKGKKSKMAPKSRPTVETTDEEESNPPPLRRRPKAAAGALNDPKGKKKAMEEPDIDLSAVKWEVEKALPSSDDTGDNGEGHEDGEELDDELELEYVDIEPDGTSGPSAPGPPPRPTYAAAAAAQPAGAAIPKLRSTAAASSSAAAAAKSASPAPTTPSGPAPTVSSRKAAARSAAAAPKKSATTAAASSSGTAAAKSAGPAPPSSSGPAPTASSSKAVTKSAAGAPTMPSGTAVATPSGTSTSKSKAKPGPGPGRHYQAPPVGKSAVKRAVPAGQSASAPPRGLGKREISLEGDFDYAMIDWTKEQYAMEPIADSGFWRPSPAYQPPVPAPTSPAAAMVEGNQEAFLQDLEPGEEYTHMKEGGFFPGFPPYLRWWFHQSCLPQVFHTMDLDAFKALLAIVTDNMRSSGTCSHANLLALGLIARDLGRALGGADDDDDRLMSNLTPEHAAAFLAVMQDLAGICKTKSTVFAVDPQGCTLDPVGYIWPTDKYIATGEDRSPATSAGDNKTAVPFMKSLTTCQAYHHALMAGTKKAEPRITSMLKIKHAPWSKGIPFCLSWYRETYYAGLEFHRSSEGVRAIFDGIVAQMSQLPHTTILHTHLLAFGLAMRDIEAAVNACAGEELDHPFVLESSLTEDDLHYIIAKLKGVLARAGHGSYLPEERGPSRMKSGVR